MPLEKTAPTKTPKLAIIIIFLKEITFEPIAEFKKFTASLLTPTTRSNTARAPKAITIKKNILSIFIICYSVNLLLQCYLNVNIRNVIQIQFEIPIHLQYHFFEHNSNHSEFSVYVLR